MRVRYYGHVGQWTGYGNAAMDLCMALLRAGVQLEVRPLAPFPSHVKLPDAYRSLAYCIGYWTGADATLDAIIVHTPPGDAERAIREMGIAGRPPGEGPLLVAYTTWEIPPVPASIRASLWATFDQVWVPSHATAPPFGRKPDGSPRALVLPHCFDESKLRGTGLQPDYPEPFMFYSLGAWSERKNHIGLIRAFELAFGRADYDSVGLRIHASDAPPSATPPNIKVTSGWLVDEDVAAMHAQCNCFVTASHGEAWNLPAFDAMLAGRHVIAPARQGSDEFLLDTSAFRYQVGRTPIQYRTGSRWDANPSAPDLDALAEAMCDAVHRRTRNLTVNYDPAARFGYEAVGKLALRYMENNP